MSFETYHLTVPASPQGEDRADILRLDNGIVMTVADGVGERPGGGEAATLLIENVVNYFVHADYEISNLALVHMLTEMDQALASDENAGETTAIVAVITEDGIAGASVGDSDAYLFLPDTEYRLTHGRRKPSLGYGAAAPEPFNAALEDGTLLLASDGLWKYAALDRIRAIVRSTQPLADIASQLVDAARLPNGSLQDDITVALCRARP